MINKDGNSLTREDLEKCKTKYDVYCIVLRYIGYNIQSINLREIIGKIENVFYRCGIPDSMISKNDLKQAVDTCVCKTKWKTCHYGIFQKNDIKPYGAQA